MSVRILQGDALAMLRTLPDKSVQCVVTSPPYFQLRDYGVDGQIGLERTPAAFLDALYAVFDEVRRVLRDDGCVFVNMGDSYAGSGKGPTGSNGIGDQEQRQGFTGGRGKTSQVWRGDPAGRDSQKRVGGVEGARPKSLLLIPERFAIGMADRGWIVRSQIVWAKKSAMPESVRDRPTSAWEPIWMFTKQPRYFWDADAVRTDSLYDGPPKPGQYAGLVQNGGKSTMNLGVGNPAGANLRNVWHLGPEPQGSFTWSERVPVSVDDADDDTERTTSPDCPIHAGRRASTSRRGALPGDPQSRNQRTDSRPAPGRQGADAPTADLFSAALETASSDGLVASPHSTTSSRTAPHAATSVPDTASEGTSRRTGDIRETHESSAPHPDTHGSSTASVDSGDARGLRTPAGTAGSVLSEGRTASTGLRDAVSMTTSSTSGGGSGGPSIRTSSSSRDKSTCTCSYSKVIIQESAHFASYPTEIPRRCILAATRKGDTVLDPFLGSGTTALVADRLERNAIGIELSPQYAAMARRRIEGDAPLFADVEVAS